MAELSEAQRLNLEHMVALADTWRHRATVACVANPQLWLAVHGVPLNDYLAKIGELEKLCRRALDQAGKAT
jgi:hypothetical protein